MPYDAKTDWKYDDTVTENDMNRIEQGIKDAIEEVENISESLTPESIGAVTKMDFNTHVTDTTKHPTVEKQASWDAKVPINGAVNKHGFMNVIADGQTMGLVGNTTSFIGFYPTGTSTRAGYIGASRPNEPSAMVLAADAGILALYGTGIYLNNRDVVSELDQVKTSGVSAKQGVVDAINAQGGSASTADDWATLAQKIRAISRGIGPAYLQRNTDYFLPQYNSYAPAWRNGWQKGYVENEYVGGHLQNAYVTLRPESGFMAVTPSSEKSPGRAQVITGQPTDLTNVGYIIVDYTYNGSYFPNQDIPLMLGVMRNFNISGVFYDRYVSTTAHRSWDTIHRTVSYRLMLDVKDLIGNHYVGIDVANTVPSYHVGGFIIKSVMLVQDI